MQCSMSPGLVTLHFSCLAIFLSRHCSMRILIKLNSLVISLTHGYDMCLIIWLTWYKIFSVLIMFCSRRRKFMMWQHYLGSHISLCIAFRSHVLAVFRSDHPEWRNSQPAVTWIHLSEPGRTRTRSDIGIYLTRREFLREILYKNITIISIQHGKFILLTPLAIFPILLGEIHSSPYGKFPYTY